jgi:hypothetical protein
VPEPVAEAQEKKSVPVKQSKPGKITRPAKKKRRPTARPGGGRKPRR